MRRVTLWLGTVLRVPVGIFGEGQPHPTPADSDSVAQPHPPLRSWCSSPNPCSPRVPTSTGVSPALYQSTCCNACETPALVRVSALLCSSFLLLWRPVQHAPLPHIV